jgi:hypothetical protein
MNGPISESASWTQQVHDVAIINVSALPASVMKGGIVHINVTSGNLGSLPETFNVTVYANSTVLSSVPVTLLPGENQTLYFLWNTTNVAPGLYYISASASVVPGETNTANNSLSDGAVLVYLPVPVGGVVIEVNVRELIKPFIGLPLLIFAVASLVLVLKKKIWLRMGNRN